MEDVVKTGEVDLPWEKLRGRRVMLSGATGLIGSFLADVILEKNRREGLDCTVVALGRHEDEARARFSRYTGDPHFVFVRYDVKEPLAGDAAGNADYVLHLASNTHPLQYATDPIGTVTTNILGLQILVPTGKEKTVLYSEIAGAVTDLVLNALLIPRFHASGAAMGTVMAELVVLIWQYVALKDEVTSMFQSVPVLPIVTALLAAAAVSLWVKLLGLGFFVTLLISACLFFAGYLAVLLIWKEPFTTDLLRQVKNRLMLG